MGIASYLMYWYISSDMRVKPSKEIFPNFVAFGHSHDAVHRCNRKKNQCMFRVE